MLAYKFRSPTQMDFVFDILLKKRLYCSEWSKLNDPVEGTYVYSHRNVDGEEISTYMDSISTAKRPLRICSLSKTFDCHLLWAHYAAGFSGLALELELDERDPRIFEVEYRGVFAHISEEETLSPETAAKKILSSKYNEWSYEKEVRIIETEKWYELQAPIRRVIVGHRISDSLLDAIKIICEREYIQINRVFIGDDGLSATSLSSYRSDN